MLQSALFQGDPLLQAIADNEPPHPPRISKRQNQNDPAVVKVQTALLTWDANALPERGADGHFGPESATAVHRFKREELGLAEAEIVADDVGPLTVIRLDEIQAAAEQAPPEPPPEPAPPSLVGDFVVLAEPRASAEDQAAVLDAIEASGGSFEVGLGPLAAAFSGGEEVAEAAAQLAGVRATILPGQEDTLADLGAETAALVGAWLATFDPDFVARHDDPAREGVSFSFLDGCFPPGEGVVEE